MSFDQSRSPSNPWRSWRDFFGVVMQQGRVQLDSDWNEWLAELTRRLQAGTLDLIGVSGVPSTTPYGFKIKAYSGPPHQITIGAGRIYVDGLLAENHGPKGSSQWDPSLGEWSGAPQPPGSTTVDLDFTQQPYPPGAALLTGNGPFLVYLDVWQREVTYLECPDLIETAVGVDTTGRLQTVWQVKFLDVSNVVVNNAKVNVACSTPDATVMNYDSIIQPSQSQLTTSPASPGSSGPCSLTSGTGYTGLENQLYRVEIHHGGVALNGSPTPGIPLPGGTATFKWSRENASVATAVTSIGSATSLAGNPSSQLTVQSLGRDQVLGFHAGDWIEITSDSLELNFQPGELHQIDSIAAKTITLDSALNTTNFPLGPTTGNTRIRRWDQSGTVYLADGATVWTDLNAPITGGTGTIPAGESTGGAGIPIPSTGVSLLLEDGIAVTFGPFQNSFASGECWNFTARAADGSFENLTLARPAGIQHHYCRLGIVDFSASPNPNVTDCRRVFPSLANPCLHVMQVQVGIAPLMNGSTLSIQDLLKPAGITVSFDGPLDASIIPPTGSGSPLCSVTVDLPAANATAGGFSSLILGATVKIGSSPNTISWTTTATSAAQSALVSLFPATTPFVARLNLKGNLIWAEGQPRVYLNGAGDGRPSADFQQWFWLTSQPPTTLSATSLSFSTPQIVGTTATQTVTLTNNTSGTITINSITFSGPNASDFTETNTGTSVTSPGICTITVTFKPSAVGARTAQMSIADSVDSAAQTITLSGTAVQPALSPSTAGPIAFPSTVVGATSAAQTLTLTNTGTSQLTITGVSASPEFSETTTGLSAGSSGALQPGQACTVQLQFIPTAPGGVTGNVTIVHNAPNSPLVITLTGTAVAAVAGIGASPATLAFGSVSLGAAPTLPVAITSTGNAALQISGVTVGGAGFSLAGNACTTVQPGAQCAISVKFAPTGTASFSGILAITHNSPNSPNPLNIALSGTGVGTPAVSASTTKLLFGAVEVGSSSGPVSVTLTSTGTAPLTITGVSIASGTQFKVGTNTCSGANLQPGSTCSVSVTFTPAAVQSYSTTLLITTNATVVSIALSGSGFKKTKEGKDGKDSAISGGIIAHLPVVEQVVRAAQFRPGLLPPADVPTEAAGQAATGAAFIRPEERPAVSAQPSSEPEGQPADAEKPAEEQPGEGPKEE